MMYNVLIVGAGPSGIGMALELQGRGLQDVLIVDGSGVGASFEAWPEETRFITPSFPSHAYGCPDLNAVEMGASVASDLGVEHPSGVQYARYLRQVVDHHRLQVKAPVRVLDLHPRGDLWEVVTTNGNLTSRSVIWATGEYSDPNTDSIPGLEECVHYSAVTRWSTLAGDHFLVLGGGESGIDAACNLIALGKTVKVFDRSACWQDTASDPSWTLSPVTRERLLQAQTTRRIELVDGADIIRVESTQEGYQVQDSQGHLHRTTSRPVNCLGFKGGASQISDRWEWSGHEVKLTPEDQSTLHPGLFLLGPQVRQPGEIFCFIYKFRTRFPLVADAVQRRLNTTPTELST